MLKPRLAAAANIRQYIHLFYNKRAYRIYKHMNMHARVCLSVC